MKNPAFPHTFIDANEDVVPYDGSPITWRIGAYVLVIKNDELLIVKSKRGKFYDVVGGGIEIGETIEEGLQREAMEEAGAKINIGELVSAKQGWFYHRKGTFHQELQLFYIAELVEEMKTPTDPDIEKAIFVSLTSIDQYAFPPVVKNVIELVKKKKFSEEK